MSIKEKIILLQYYNPTIKITHKERRLWINKRWETRITLTPSYLWKVINRM
jgi:hypothetical protein